MTNLEALKAMGFPTGMREKYDAEWAKQTATIEPPMKRGYDLIDGTEDLVRNFVDLARVPFSQKVREEMKVTEHISPLWKAVSIVAVGLVSLPPLALLAGSVSGNEGLAIAGFLGTGAEVAGVIGESAHIFPQQRRVSIQ